MARTMDLSCTEFIDVLASKAPAPGGGGAAAYVGAIGMALGNMVGALTVGKKKYVAVEADIIELQRQASALQKRLIDLVAADAQAFEPLSQAYGLPSDTPADAEHKASVMEKCLHDACDVPLQIMRACCEAIDLHEEFALKGSAIAISDVGCGVICCKAALQAASLNVFINTKSMTEREDAEKRNLEAREMLDEYTLKADKIFANVEKRLS